MDSGYLQTLADKYGTPLYVYDGRQIIENYRKFNDAFDVENLKIHYACKALTNISILKLFRELGAGLDCVSIEEVKLGLHAGFNAEDIVFTPNCVPEIDYEEAIKLGVRVNVDNISMLEYMGTKQKGVPIGIRINPHLMAGGNHKISVGHIDSKFGISIHQLPHIKRLVHNLKINVQGIHIHTGSDILNNEVFIQAAELIFAVVKEFDTIEYIDFGSGFKVKYHANDLATNIESFGKSFSKTFNDFCHEMGKDYQLIFEPGKFLVSEMGYFLTTVNVVKQTTSCVFAGVNSGFNHFIRPMFYDAHHDIENISNPGGDQKVYSIVGYICESDTFGSDRLLNEVRKGDTLVFKNAGAYCFSMSSNYNSKLKPAEVLVLNGKDYLIRKAENFEDLLKNQQIPAIESWI